MGVSGLLRNVVEKYKNVIKPAPNPSTKVHYLYIDFNSFIYNTINAFPANIVYDFDNEKDVLKYEKKLVKLVIENTINLVNKVVKPSKLVYIAIDGPPPLAKMVQQRERRFKKPIIDKIIKENDPTAIISGIKYDTNRITPGTVLMDMLNKEFVKAIKKKKFKGVSVVFDGSDVPGEAEHKYLELINGMIDSSRENHVIFSQDGDVIFLSMILSLNYPKKKIYIMQNTSSNALSGIFPPEQEFAYLDVRALGTSYYDLFGRMQSGGRSLTANEKNLLAILSQNAECNLSNKVENKFGKEEFLTDWVFMSFLEGNDFVKPIYFLKYNQDRMRTLLGIYRFQKKIHNSNFYLIDSNLKINQEFFYAIIKRLSVIQNEKIEEMRNRIEKRISNPPIKRNNMENVLEHKAFTNQDHYLHKEYVKQYDQLFGDMSKFNENYYKYFFGTSNQNIVENICESYLRVLIFNLNYYFARKVSWNTCYNHLAAPLPSDLCKFLEHNPRFFESVQLEEGNPVSPFVLLAYVLPPQSMKEGTIPASYRDVLLKKYGEYYEQNDELKLLQPGGKLIYAEPHLDNPPVKMLEDVLKKVKMTADEKERNQLREEPEIYLLK